MRLLPEDLTRPQAEIWHKDRSRAISPNPKLWSTGSRLRIRFIGGTPIQRERAREQAMWWTEVANLRFDFSDAPDAEVRVAFNENEYAWSYIGTDAKRVPLDQPTMNLGSAEGTIAAHEFGHAIGLEHMRQNPRGGGQWNEMAVTRDLSGPPMHWTAEQVQEFFLNKKYLDSVSGAHFDPTSIMLDFFPPEWTVNGVGTELNDCPFPSGQATRCKAVSAGLISSEESVRLE